MTLTPARCVELLLQRVELSGRQSVLPVHGRRRHDRDGVQPLSEQRVHGVSLHKRLELLLIAPFRDLFAEAALGVELEARVFELVLQVVRGDEHGEPLVLLRHRLHRAVVAVQQGEQVSVQLPLLRLAVQMRLHLADRLGEAVGRHGNGGAEVGIILQVRRRVLRRILCRLGHNGSLLLSQVVPHFILICD